tara:strand:- start:1231 stop:1713 length:483 start_codon:yes stop_codon:yes gene_type:complete
VNLYSNNIAVIDLNFIINNSTHYLEISKKITDSQIEFKNSFQVKENELLEKKKDLENSKVILNDQEFESKKKEYYDEVLKFENEVSLFNKHYENEIINIKNFLYSQITEIVQKYAANNEYELILEKNQYLIVADKLDITDIIFNKLNNLKIELTFKIYGN